MYQLVKRVGLAALAAGLVLAPVAASADGSPEKGKIAIIKHGCFQCHGTNGQSQSDIPEINGMSANEMFQALREFKTSTETVMNQQAKVYTDAELRLIANYIATLPGGGD